jgi:hypothetical protein
MLKKLARKVVIGGALVAMVTPAAFATQTGTDPEPGVVHTILALLGLA